MNAQFEFRRARSASAALSVAIALAFGLNAPAQAQYSYPGTVASSGHYANSIHPIRAGGVERGERQPSVSGYGHSNPSMRRGEACPPGSRCAHPQTGGGSGSSHPSNGYGAHESYGAAPVQSGHATNAVHRATGGKASISPVRAGGRAALNYGPSQNSNANFRNAVSGKSNSPASPNVNSSQPISITGPNGPVKVGGTQSYTGPDGKKHGLGQQTPDFTSTGYGHETKQQNPMGNIGKASGGGAPKSTNGMDPYKAGNGAAGAGYGLSDLKKDLDWGSGGNSNSTPDAGSTKHTTPNGGPVDPNAGSDGIDRKSGVKVMVDTPKGKNPKDTADMGPTAGPGEIVSGTGQVVQPGKHTGQDGGGGQGQDSSSSNSGGRNAQGAYIAPSGQDAPVKPKEQGVLKMNYNGKNGAIDPKVNGTNGGGG